MQGGEGCGKLRLKNVGAEEGAAVVSRPQRQWTPRRLFWCAGRGSRAQGGLCP